MSHSAPLNRKVKTRPSSINRDVNREMSSLQSDDNISYFLSPYKTYENSTISIFVFGILVLSMVIYLMGIFIRKKSEKFDHIEKLIDSKKEMKRKVEEDKEKSAAFEKAKALRQQTVKMSSKNADCRWDESKDFSYSAEELQALYNIIHNIDLTLAYNPNELFIKNDESTKKAKENQLVQKHKFSKQERPQTLATQSQIILDKKIIWSENLPGYNLTKDRFDDANKPVYRLKSKNRFVFVNQFLQMYLQDNDSILHQRLETLCSQRNDQMSNNSKNQTGFAIREETNAKKLDKFIAVSKENTNDKKNKNDKKFYIKGKISSPERFYGESVATKNGFTLFEINGYKPDHGKKTKIIYFPSETLVEESVKQLKK